MQTTIASMPLPRIPQPAIATTLGRTERGVLLALSLGAFAVGTEGFMIAALLPGMATSLDVTIGQAGQLVTLFALVYALSSPVLTIATARWSRHRVLLVSLGAFALSNIVAAVAGGYGALAFARILLALAAGLFVPNANAVAGLIVPVAWRGRALAIVNGGSTVAIALGVPFGALVGAHFGWRATFGIVALMSGAALAVLAWVLPRNLANPPVATLRQRVSAIGQPGAFRALATTTVWAAGSYAMYTYIAPYLHEAAGLDGASAGWVLTLLGFCALIGVTLGGMASDRLGASRVHAISLPATALAFAGLSVVAFFFAPHALVPVLALVVVWGAGVWSFLPPQQQRLATLAGPANAAVMISLNASFIYLGFSLGAAGGSLVIHLSSIVWLGLVAAVCQLIALALSQHRADAVATASKTA